MITQNRIQFECLFDMNFLDYSMFLLWFDCTVSSIISHMRSTIFGLKFPSNTLLLRSEGGKAEGMPIFLQSNILSDLFMVKMPAKNYVKLNVCMSILWMCENDSTISIDISVPMQRLFIIIFILCPMIKSIHWLTLPNKVNPWQIYIGPLPQYVIVSLNNDKLIGVFERPE